MCQVRAEITGSFRSTQNRRRKLPIQVVHWNFVSVDVGQAPRQVHLTFKVNELLQLWHVSNVLLDFDQTFALD